MTPAEALAQLSAWERNFLTLYARGGLEAVRVELGAVTARPQADRAYGEVKTDQDAERVLAAIQAKLAKATNGNGNGTARRAAEHDREASLAALVESFRAEVSALRREVAELRGQVDASGMDSLDVTLAAVVAGLAKIGRGELDPVRFVSELRGQREGRTT